MNNNLIQLFYQSEDFFYRAISRKCLDFEDYASFYITGLRSEYLNPFTQRDNIPAIKNILKECIEFAQQQNLNWIIVISEHIINKNLELTLSNINFKFDSKTKPMFINLNQYNNTYQHNHLIINANDNIINKYKL